MTRTGPANVAMSACAHAATGLPVPARSGFRDPVSVWPASGEPTVVRAVFPGSASFKPAAGRAPGRSRRRQPDRRPPASTLPHRPAQSSSLAYPLYLYLLEWPAVALPGWSIDPGRDMLCILTSLPRWLQWP
jgi:hypothetical protein